MLSDHLPLDWLEGYRRVHRLLSFKGQWGRARGEAVLAHALRCVGEDGRRRRPFPSPRAVTGHEVAEIRAAARAAERAERRRLLGVG